MSAEWLNVATSKPAFRQASVGSLTATSQTQEVTFLDRRLFDHGEAPSHIVTTVSAFILFLIGAFIFSRCYRAIRLAKLRRRRHGLLPCYEGEELLPETYAW